VTFHFPEAVLAGSTIAVGTGLHTATWGAFKDSPYEGFHPARLARTLVVALLAAWTAVLTRLVDPAAVVPTVGVLYTLERLATEWWKTIVRAHDAAAFTIPMRLGFRGRPVDIAWHRYLVGISVLVGMFAVGLAMHLLQGAVPGAPWWVVVTVGGFGGWLTALGGAWKDAPIEGFSGWKFLRSPLVATAWAVPCSALTDDWVTLCLASGGFAVATIETYKTFMTGDQPPGKFAGRGRRHDVSSTRAVLAKLHALAWSLLGLGAVWSALHAGAPVPWLVGAGSAAVVASLVVAGVALAAGQISLRAGRIMAGPLPREAPASVARPPEPPVTSGRPAQ
jgi:hypothetical protein